MSRWSPSVLPDPDEPGVGDYFARGLVAGGERGLAEQERIRAESRAAKRARAQFEFEDEAIRRRNAENRAAEIERTMRQGGWRPTLMGAEVDTEIPNLTMGVMGSMMPGTRVRGRAFADPTPPGYVRDRATLEGQPWHRFLRQYTQRPLVNELRAQAVTDPLYDEAVDLINAGRVDELTPAQRAAAISGGISPNIVAGAILSEGQRRRTPQATAGTTTNQATLDRQARQDAVTSAKGIVQTFIQQHQIPIEAGRVGESRFRNWKAANPALATEYANLLEDLRLAQEALNAADDDF